MRGLWGLRLVNLDQTGGAGALISTAAELARCSGLARPAGHDTGVPVATQDPLPHSAFGPTPQAVAAAVCPP